MPSPRRSRRRAWAASACSTACATGASRASATGAARSRSSTARPAARCRCRMSSCRCCCRRTWCPMAAATRSPSPRPSTSAPVRAARAPRDAKPTPWTPSSTPPGTSCATRAPMMMSDGGCARGLLAAGGSVHRRHRARHPAPAVLALLDQGDARFRGAEIRRAVHEPAHPGHGAQPRLLPPDPRGAQALLQSGRHRRAPRTDGHEIYEVSIPEVGTLTWCTRAWARCPSPRATGSTRRA